MEALEGCKTVFYQPVGRDTNFGRQASLSGTGQILTTIYFVYYIANPIITKL
jgi:hypothetical protein